MTPGGYDGAGYTPGSQYGGFDDYSSFAQPTAHRTKEGVRSKFFKMNDI